MIGLRRYIPVALHLHSQMFLLLDQLKTASHQLRKTIITHL